MDGSKIRGKVEKEKTYVGKSSNHPGQRKKAKAGKRRRRERKERRGENNEKKTERRRKRSTPVPALFPLSIRLPCRFWILHFSVPLSMARGEPNFDDRFFTPLKKWRGDNHPKTVAAVGNRALDEKLSKYYRTPKPSDSTLLAGISRRHRLRLATLVAKLESERKNTWRLGAFLREQNIAQRQETRGLQVVLEKKAPEIIAAAQGVSSRRECANMRSR